MTDDQITPSLIKQLRALGEPTRIRIVGGIASAGPVTVGVLAERLRLPFMAVSHHMKLLRQAGILADERRGRHVVYHFAPGVFTPSQMAGALGTLHFGGWRISIGRTAGK
ncbi:ArsR/SmtB family transcription factor [Limnoglobus roseus]|uniref:ArsR family transcriptional regulator n=1 Tax=Limnoglobus roseus TaxID=2598579 RepID=A0A5C1ADW9_9BACT|nr:metalloregulator ArsR/SmtB family transcription factor [Limnoglobus roseus]QEL17569.1 ArsR family transcriptional regulator [Limnoglobus roseus]